MTIIWIACNVKNLPQWYYDNVWYNAAVCVLIEAWLIGSLVYLAFKGVQ